MSGSVCVAVLLLQQPCRPGGALTLRLRPGVSWVASARISVGRARVSALDRLCCLWAGRKARRHLRGGSGAG